MELIVENTQDPIADVVAAKKFNIARLEREVARDRALLALVGVECKTEAVRNPVSIIVAALNRAHPYPLACADIARSEDLDPQVVEDVADGLEGLGLATEAREGSICLIEPIRLRKRGKAEAAEAAKGPTP
jgi:hypothetical protein